MVDVLDQIGKFARINRVTVALLARHCPARLGPVLTAPYGLRLTIVRLVGPHCFSDSCWRMSVRFFLAAQDDESVILFVKLA